MSKILSVYNSLLAGDYENGNGGKRRVSRLTQVIQATLQFLARGVVVCKKLSLSQSTSVHSVSEALATMRYIN